MNKGNFMSNLDKATSSNKILSLMVYLIGGLVLYNTYVIQDLPNKERTILIPTGLDRKVWIVGDKASDEYMKATARDIAGLALNYTPATVKNNFAEVLTYYGPDQFDAARASFYALEESILKGEFSSAFYIQKYSLDDNTNVMELTGQRNLFKQGANPTTTILTYIIRFNIINGKFRILEMYEKKDGKPKAQEPAK